MGSIFVGKNGLTEGPYPEEIVRARLADGELALSDLGWREGLSGWVPLSELLAIPTASLPLRLSPAPVAQRSSGCALFLTITIVVLGIAGSCFDLGIAVTLFQETAAVRADANLFASEHPLAATFLRSIVPDFDSNVDQTIHAIKTAGLILLSCGVVGLLGSVLFFFRRLVKTLAILLLVCGVAPMFHHPIEFVGLPMALAGFLALFVRERTRRAPNGI